VRRVGRRSGSLCSSLKYLKMTSFSRSINIICQGAHGELGNYRAQQNFENNFPSTVTTSVGFSNKKGSFEWSSAEWPSSVGNSRNRPRVDNLKMTKGSTFGIFTYFKNNVGPILNNITSQSRIKRNWWQPWRDWPEPILHQYPYPHAPWQLNSFKGLGGNEKLPPRRFPMVGIVRIIRQTTTQLPPQTSSPWCSVCPPYSIDSMNRPNTTRGRPFEGDGRGRLGGVLY